MILDVRNIAKRYGSQQVLDNLSFSIHKGEIVGFLGPNGAGKTTTMKIITGCIQADEGSVMIEDYNISGDSLKAKAIVGYLPENNPLYDEMYIPEYLEYVAKLYSKNNIRKQVKETIFQTGLQPKSHKRILQLSKGYRQRVGLAQAIIHNPKLLILDEPASGLDPNQLEETNELLINLSKEKAILLSSHTLSEVQTICTRIIIIHNGRIMVDSPTKEIGDLEKLFKESTRISNS